MSDDQPIDNSAKTKKKSSLSEMEQAITLIAQNQVQMNNSLKSALTAMNSEVAEMKNAIIAAGEAAAQKQAAAANSASGSNGANIGGRQVIDVDDSGNRRHFQPAGQQNKAMGMLGNIDPNAILALAEAWKAINGSGGDLYAQVGKRVILEGVLNQSYNMRATNRMLLKNGMMKEEEVKESEEIGDNLWKPVKEMLLKADKEKKF